AGDQASVEVLAIAVEGLRGADEDVPEERSLLIGIVRALAPPDRGVVTNEPDRNVLPRGVDVSEEAGRDIFLAILAAGPRLPLGSHAYPAGERVRDAELVLLDDAACGG